MQTIGKCKLCQLEKPLLNRSHIIPDFMYASLFDKDHKLNKFAPADYIEGDKHISRPSSGEYESNLLCSQCDNEIIGRYETYARKALYSKVDETSDLPECENFITNGGLKFTKCKNLHYKEFKLFLLSILWRASISNRDFFKEVNLGPYEDTIRQMILSGDPKQEETFPILMMTWLNDKSFATDLVGQPGINRKENGIRYIFPIAGVTYIYHISPVSLKKDLKEFILSSKNEATLLHIPEGKSKEFLMTYFGVNKS
ncbi:MAG: hypothetical protein Q8K98_14780 [Bacteroidota bacterium]|nr:hypothetical protein [Bacteroidota bacterium]